MFEFIGRLVAWFAEYPVVSVLVVSIQFAVGMRMYHNFENKYARWAFRTWFWPQDVLANIFGLTVIGMEPPRELTISARVERWSKLDPEGKVENKLLSQRQEIPVISVIVTTLLNLRRKWHIWLGNKCVRFILKHDPAHYA